MGHSIDPRRFRANLYLDGAPPWVELDWVGCDVRRGERYPLGILFHNTE
jgi:hypothetical protein